MMVSHELAVECQDRVCTSMCCRCGLLCFLRLRLYDPYQVGPNHYQSKKVASVIIPVLHVQVSLTTPSYYEFALLQPEQILL